MLMVREILRSIAAVVGYAVQGRRLGLLVVILLGAVAVAASAAVTASVPLAIYPFI